MGLLPTSKIVKECQRGSGHLESETRDFSKRFRKIVRKCQACANREFQIKQYGQKLTTDASASRRIFGDRDLQSIGMEILGHSSTKRFGGRLNAGDVAFDHLLISSHQ
jgi:hypothetical protein